MSAGHPFQVGDRVVCINDSPSKWVNWAPHLELGCIYTITRAEFGVSPRDGITLGACVNLAEAPFDDDSRRLWSAHRFELHERARRP